MWQEFKDKPINHGFSRARFFDTMLPAMSPTMESSNEARDGEPVGKNAGPRASAWLWRPWYAKLWWLSMAGFWAGKVASFSVPALDAFYASALAGYLNVLFFPMTALLILGIGFVQAWIAASDWEFVEPTQEEMFPKLSISGFRDPYSDPLDPRSGLHWQHFHSEE